MTVAAVTAAQPDESPSARVARLVAMPPSGDVLDKLSRLNPGQLSPDDLVSVLECLERCRSWVDGVQQPLLAEIHWRPGLAGEDGARLEVGLALRWTENFAGQRLWIASQLLGHLHRTYEALRSGLISLRQAEAIVEGTAHLSPTAALVVEGSALARAPQQTPGQTRSAVRRAAAAADPEAEQERCKKARRERRVEDWGDQGHGMAALYVNGPAEQIAAVRNVLTAHALDLEAAGLVETLDAGRFDALVALCTGAGNAAGVLNDVTVNVGMVAKTTTLAGLDDEPGELIGYGPITADTARRIAGSETANDKAKWRLLPVDPSTGWLTTLPDQDLDKGRTTRQVRGRLAEFIRDRDRFCAIPICSRSADGVGIDIDHRVEHARGGPTDTVNLNPLCSHNNRVTKNNGFRIEPHPDGSATLITPLGRRYPIEPHRYWEPEAPDPPPPP